MDSGPETSRTSRQCRPGEEQKGPGRAFAAPFGSNAPRSSRHGTATHSAPGVVSCARANTQGSSAGDHHVALPRCGKSTAGMKALNVQIRRPVATVLPSSKPVRARPTRSSGVQNHWTSDATPLQHQPRGGSAARSTMLVGFPSHRCCA